MPRSTSLTPELASEICRRVADGESLRRICRDPDMPGRSTVLEWLADDENAAFRRQYELAREAMADALFEDMREIADDTTGDYVEREGKNGAIERFVDHENIQRSKLRVDTLKWQCAKLLPRKYGDRLAVDSTVEMHDQRSDAEIIARLATLAEELGLPFDRAAIATLAGRPESETRH